MGRHRIPRSGGHRRYHVVGAWHALAAVYDPEERVPPPGAQPGATAGGLLHDLADWRLAPSSPAGESRARRRWAAALVAGYLITVVRVYRPTHTASGSARGADGAEP